MSRLPVVLHYLRFEWCFQSHSYKIVQYYRWYAFIYHSVLSSFVSFHSISFLWRLRSPAYLSSICPSNHVYTNFILLSYSKHFMCTYFSPTFFYPNTRRRIRSRRRKKKQIQNEELNFFSYLTGERCIRLHIAVSLWHSHLYLMTGSVSSQFHSHFAIPSTNSTKIQSTKWNKLSIFVLVNPTNNVTIAI